MVRKLHTVVTGRISGILKVLGILAVATVIAAPAGAHHSYAMFDQSQEITVSGVVKRWYWTNPHTMLVVTVENADGEDEDYYFEANGPGILAKNGWSRTMVRPGDEVTVVSHPLRDPEATGGDIQMLTLPDGSQLSAKPQLDVEIPSDAFTSGFGSGEEE